MNDVGASLRHFVRENFLFGRDDPLGDGDSFLDLGIIDSTGVLELVAFVESTFQIPVEDEELVPENLDSIDNLVRFVEAKRSVASGQRSASGDKLSAISYQPSAISD